MLQEVELEAGWLSEVINTVSEDIQSWPESMKSLLEMIEEQET